MFLISVVEAILLIVAAVYIFFYARERKKSDALYVLLEDAIQSTPMGFLLFDHNDKLQKINMVASQMIPEFKGKDDHEHTVDDFLDFVFANRHQSKVNFDYKLSSAEQTNAFSHDFKETIMLGGRYFLMQATHTRGAALVVFITDITDIKQREEDLLRLHRENYQLVQAVEATSSGIIICNPKHDDLPVVFVNEALSEMLDTHKDRMLGTSWKTYLQSLVNEEEHVLVTEALNNQVTFKKDCIKDYRGRLISYELTMSPVLDHAGDIDLYIGVMTDVTDLRMQEERFMQNQKLEALGRLAGGVAHDFNNLISIIDGYSRMIVKNLPPEDEKTKEYVSRVRQAAKRGAELTKQLLLFGRHKMSSSSTIDMADIMSQQIKLIEPLLDSSIHLEAHTEKDLYVACAPDAMTQILMNLVLNARDAMPEGGLIELQSRRALKDEISSSKALIDKDKDYICISVKDSGIGMDKKLVGRIFEPFFTTKDQGRGTGLGLSMVYGLVNEMKGFIDVNSTLGEGTMIKLFLPISDAEANYQVRKITSQSGKLSFEGYTVLIAEDEPDLLSVMEDAMVELGFEVITAVNGNDALLKQDEYIGDIDFLLTDVVMPELNGVKLAELFKAVREETKVIFMSGFPANGKLSRLEIPEGEVFLSKPVDIDALGDLMSELAESSNGAGVIYDVNEDMSVVQA